MEHPDAALDGWAQPRQRAAIRTRTILPRDGAAIGVRKGDAALESRIMKYSQFDIYSE